MNPRGSYKALRNHSRAAMLAAIEIYNKPRMTYRDETFCILLINSWELLLKAILAKNKKRIYYPKERGQPYRTFSIEDALVKTQKFFPSSIGFQPVSKNIQMLITYRNNAIHFYNQRAFQVVIYGLAQTSIVNYRDLLLSKFNIDIANEMTISLLPLSFGIMPDPIEFLQKAKIRTHKNKAVAQYLKEISMATKELESQELDTTRFLTVYTVNLQSVKKVTSADIKVAVAGFSEGSEPLIVERRVDPNISHSWRQKDVLKKLGFELNGIRFSPYTFQALVWMYDIKNKPHLCWIPSATGGSPQYSPEIATLLSRLSKQEIQTALKNYSENQKKTRKRYHSAS
ncbi:MAG TPA: DUF3644 domain-containing protein [Anaerolineales bacterium]